MPSDMVPGYSCNLPNVFLSFVMHVLRCSEVSRPSFPEANLCIMSQQGDRGSATLFCQNMHFQ
jgi:hypothetical protein